MFPSILTPRRTAVAVIAMAAIGLWAPKPAAASSCTTPLGAFNQWFLAQPNGPGNYEIDSLFASNNSNGSYVSYGEGSAASPIALTYHAALAPRGPKLPGYPAYISESSPAVQYFSDRRYGPPGSLATYPFNPSATDSLGIQIILQDWPRLNIPAGQTTFTLYSWGKSQYTMAGTCQNGMLYGFIGNTLETFSLNEFFYPNPHDGKRARGASTLRRGYPATHAPLGTKLPG
jgi:hypothetical protein